MSKISLKHSGGNVVSLNSPTSAPTSADVAFKLPNADGSAGQFMKTDGSGNLSFDAVSAGITMADQWRITSNFDVSVNTDTYMTSNWERNDTAGYGLLGSGMSESSGVFTFPETGIYLVQLHTEAYFSTQTNPRLICRINTTTDGSSYVQTSRGTMHSSIGGYYNSSDTFAQFDVTNTSTHKVRFLYYHTGASAAATIMGSSSQNETFVGFIRLGDT